MEQTEFDYDFGMAVRKQIKMLHHSFLIVVMKYETHLHAFAKKIVYSNSRLKMMCLYIVLVNNGL